MRNRDARHVPATRAQSASADAPCSRPERTVHQWKARGNAIALARRIRLMTAPDEGDQIPQPGCHATPPSFAGPPGRADLVAILLLTAPSPSITVSSAGQSSTLSTVHHRIAGAYARSCRNVGSGDNFPAHRTSEDLAAPGLLRGSRSGFVTSPVFVDGVVTTSSSAPRLAPATDFAERDKR